MRKQQIGWKRERDSTIEREREREKNKSGLKISNWQELGGVTSVQNFLQAPPSCSNTGHYLLTGSGALPCVLCPPTPAFSTHPQISLV
jgi:hypothetical protein